MPTNRLRKDTFLKAHQSYNESRRDEAPASQGEDRVEDGKDGLVEGHSDLCNDNKREKINRGKTCCRSSSK